EAVVGVDVLLVEGPPARGRESGDQVALRGDRLHVLGAILLVVGLADIGSGSHDLLLGERRLAEGLAGNGAKNAACRSAGPIREVGSRHARAASSALIFLWYSVCRASSIPA